MSRATVPWEIAFDAPPDVRDALAAMGRTEDVRLSPSGRRLAFACFERERVAFADVEIAVSPSGFEISLTSFDELESMDLHQPHGLDFADDNTLVVANRAGEITVFRLPASGEASPTTRHTVDGKLASLLDGTGSVAVRALGPGRYEVLACNNFANAVTRHQLDADGALTRSEVLVERWLDVPDGLVLSGDGRWLAVSNHNAHGVFIYEYAGLDRDTADPVGILRSVKYPHGIRFGADDGCLVVADAGAPLVHVFLPSDGGWDGVRYPAATIRVMDDDTFARGRHNPREGGPKGIDVDPRRSVLIVTAECLPVAFFDLAAALDGGGADNDHTVLLRAELDLLAEAKALRVETEQLKAESRELRASAAAARAQLAELQQSISWRITAPVRRTIDTARRRRRTMVGEP